MTFPSARPRNVGPPLVHVAFTVAEARQLYALLSLSYDSTVSRPDAPGPEATRPCPVEGASMTPLGRAACKLYAQLRRLTHSGL